MDAESSQVAWHWDKDYSLEHGGINISPHLATVTYLSDVGAPTLMVDKTCSTDYSANISGEANVALLSRPQYGKHVVFDGRYLHAAPSELSLWASDSSGGDGVEGEERLEDEQQELGREAEEVDGIHVAASDQYMGNSNTVTPACSRRAVISVRP